MSQGGLIFALVFPWVKIIDSSFDKQVSLYTKKILKIVLMPEMQLYQSL